MLKYFNRLIYNYKSSINKQFIEEFAYKIKNKNILIGIYYIVLCFLLLDPLYMSILSKFIRSCQVSQ